MAARKAKKSPKSALKKAVSKKASGKAATEAAPPTTVEEPAKATSPEAPVSKVNKTEFILLQDPQMPAKQVVAKAAEAGLSLTEKAVYNARGTEKKRQAAAKAAKKEARKAAKGPSAAAPVAAPAAAPAPKKAGRPVGSGPASKSAFIRRQPLDMPVSQVVSAGAAAGLKFSASLVYGVRGSMNKGGAKAAVASPAKARASLPSTVKAPASPAVPAVPAATPVRTGASERERTLVALAVDVGLARAVELIEGLRRRIDALF